MKKYLFTSLLAVALTAGFLASCSDDEDNSPSIKLSETDVTASAGDEVTVTVTTKTPAGFGSLVVTKLWDGVPVVGEEEIFDEEQDEYVYTVVEEDADHVVTINFKVIDADDKSASKDLVITIQLTARQLLLKYNWRMNEQIRKKTSVNDIQDVYNDDVYRFNADGTYNMSNGTKNDAFRDEVTKYCYYSVNDNTLRLLMSMTTYDNTLTKITKVDTLDIQVIDETKFYAKTFLLGLNELDPTYDPREEYEFRFVAIAKTPNFDPYKAGAADDATGPISTDTCEDVEFEND